MTPGQRRRQDMSMEQPQPPIRDEPLATPPRRRPNPLADARGMLLAGLAVGTAVSAVVWLVLWDLAGELALYSIPAAKVLAAVICVTIAGWRPFGLGLLLSIGVGALIFVGKCFYSIGD